MTRLWKVTLGKDGQYEGAAFAQNILTINFSITSDVSYATDRGAFVALMQETFPDRDAGAHQNFATQLTQFILQMEEGDLVVCPIKGNRSISIARVVGAYTPSSETGRPTRPIEWLARDLPREVFGQDLLASFNTPNTISPVGAGNALARVQAVIETGEDPEVNSPKVPLSDTRGYFLKVNGELHCPKGICRPESSFEWEGGEILLPIEGPMQAQMGKRQDAPAIETGDILWIWTHESPEYGNGRGLTAKAFAADVRPIGDQLAVSLENVELIKSHIAYAVFPRDDENRVVSGSRLIDFTHTRTEYAAYLIDDDDYAEFIALVEKKSRELPEEVRHSYAEGWEKEVLTHKDDLLEGLRTRRATTQKSRSGQGQFREALIARYKGRRTISSCAVPEALEAAHVMPHTGDPKWDHPDNGMLLRRDLHALFDAMLWSIDPKSNRLRVAERLKTTSYGKLDGCEIIHSVAPALLNVHFRQFKKSETDG